MKVEVRSLCKEIKRVPVLENVDMTLESGVVYGLQGKNGSGKTMLLRALAGLIRPTSGSVVVDGEQLGRDRSFPESVGLLIENPSFIDKYTGRKNLRLIAGVKSRIGDAEVDRALGRVGLDPSDRRHFKKYSLGMKQRLGIACAVMEHPDLILLDEPVNALDPTGVSCVERIIEEERSRGAIVVVACHDREELVLLADVVFTMAEGRIVDSEVVRK